MNKHKHYELILAWAEGQEIEYKDGYSTSWTTVTTPSWCVNTEYRIKKQIWEPKGGTYRMGFTVHATPGIQRETEESANKSIKKIKKYLLLLAYIDEFDPEFKYTKGEKNYYVYYDYYTSLYTTSTDRVTEDLGKIYMSEQVARDLAYKLNSGEVVI